MTSVSLVRLVRPVPVSLLAAVLALALGGCRGGEGDSLEEPVPLYGEVPIAYPLELWDREVEGVTLLRVRVTETGEVDSVAVLNSSGHPAFDSAALSGALQLRYTPARRRGKRIAVWATVPVHFARPIEEEGVR